MFCATLRNLTHLEHCDLIGHVVLNLRVWRCSCLIHLADVFQFVDPGPSQHVLSRKYQKAVLVTNTISIKDILIATCRACAEMKKWSAQFSICGKDRPFPCDNDVEATSSGANIRLNLPPPSVLIDGSEAIPNEIGIRLRGNSTSFIARSSVSASTRTLRVLRRLQTNCCGRGVPEK